jgi:hypothetical protein
MAIMKVYDWNGICTFQKKWRSWKALDALGIQRMKESDEVACVKIWENDDMSDVPNKRMKPGYAH